MGTNAIYVSLTAIPGGGGCPATAQVSLMGVTINVADTANDVSVTFGVYDQPSQAAAGGATGRIVTKTGAYVKFSPSYTLVTNTGAPFTGAAQTNTADVAESPPFSRFLIPTTPPTVGGDIQVDLGSVA